MPSQTELRQQITDQIIQALKKNLLPWRRPWSVSPNVGRPANAVSRNVYRGINPLLLELHALKHGLRSRWYATFDQWQTMGCTVNRRPDHVEPGQWGARIVFFKPVKKAVPSTETGEEGEERFFVMRGYTVFAADQVSGELSEQYKVAADTTESAFPDYQPADELIAATGADIRNEGDRAYYALPVPRTSWPHHSSGDYIVLPSKSRFDPLGSYYETAFHELGHWSEVRTGWDSAAHGYAMNELVAEMAACYVSTELCIPQGESMENHAAYLRSWLEGMQGDHNFIFRAATQASKVTDFLLSFVRKTEAIAA